MAWFKIYAGMGGSFGGAQYHGTYEYDIIDDALKEAYRLAEKEYQSYEGCHGIMSWEDCKEDLLESGFLDDGLTEVEQEQYIDDHYMEEIESWICYYVEPATGPDDVDEE